MQSSLFWTHYVAQVVLKFVILLAFQQCWSSGCVILADRECYPLFFCKLSIRLSWPTGSSDPFLDKRQNGKQIWHLLIKIQAWNSLSGQGKNSIWKAQDIYTTSPHYLHRCQVFLNAWLNTHVMKTTNREWTKLEDENLKGKISRQFF